MNATPYRPAAAALALLAGAAAAPGQAVTRTYGPPNNPAAHEVTIRTQGNIAPEVRLGYTLYTHARTNRCYAAPNGSSGRLLSGPLGVGLFSAPAQTTNMVNSWASAEAFGDVIALGPGRAELNYWVAGSATADITGCPPPALPRGRAYAHASSSAAFAVRGRNEDSRGRIRFKGNWRVTEVVTGATRASRGMRDPIIGTQNDMTTGISTRYVLGSVKAIVGGGQTAWQNDVLSSTARRLFFDVHVGDAAATVEHGSIRLRVDEGVVTESAATGMFAGLPVPAVGAPGAFSVPFPAIEINYDLGGDPTHVLEPQIDVDGGTEVDVMANGLAENGALLTDIGAGVGGANISELLPGDSVLGLSAGIAQQHLADDFIVPNGAPWILDALDWPFYQTGAPADAPITAVFVRLWRGQPGLPSALVAGDMTTNRLHETDFAGLYRVDADVSSNARAVKTAIIDMSWAPELLPGQYWLEVAARGAPGFPAPETPPGIWRDADANAMAFDPANEQWHPVRDPLGERPLSIPFRLYGLPAQAGCYANCDGSTRPPVLNVNDFICFQSRFAATDPYADCDGSGVHNVNDFVCYQSRFAAGCR